MAEVFASIVATRSCRPVVGQGIVSGGSSEGAADAAAVSCRVGEAVEVGARGLEIADQDASGPVGGGGDGGAGCGDYFLEGGIFG